ncbi:NAD(P)-dependent alcohol dehydrogenase [Secundilactobacillus collinoides]|uniref:Zinc-containing alcohol dehydrogenase n=2 Tax=Secundilactobacillus collinoides TaxID=33960 RepID=A0A0R2BCL0_SECCO|nr:NAD(P)-dependent alcohol dehydrogenase [Secundilactobacillus collinoides]KRM77149.1 zinc-containing alcohol dehydrogenase [Secundilactobacillus collinoides DSM 20515 = JCM 1123]
MQCALNTKPQRATQQLMKRVVYNQFGGPEVLKLSKGEVPQVKRGQVLVKMAATSINGGDLAFRQGPKYLKPFIRLPRALGQDVVGKVVALGSGVTDFHVGDRVWGNTTTSSNAAAEFVAVPAHKLSLMPVSLTMTEAAGLPCSATTALVALVDKGHIKHGDEVLIRGAGGVGTFGVQIAKTYGANVTILGSHETIAEMARLGADRALDYHRVKAEQLGKFDIIFDTVGTQQDAFRTNLKPAGRLLTISLDGQKFLTVVKSLRYGKHRSRVVVAFPNRANLSHLAELVDTGRVKPVTDGVYPMNQVVEAYQRAEKHGIVGKIVIQISEAE